ncbi:hypothetical protein [Actinokineospora sp.]|uniref:hypothetical protein n=1 Tax=Actinokineospora sp. TaxID=1872133 RepID=UPI00403790C4
MNYPYSPYYGQPPYQPYWGPKPPSRAMAAVAALVFFACCLLMFMIVVVGWSLEEVGSGHVPNNPQFLTAAVGIQLVDHVGPVWQAPRVLTAVVGVFALLLAPTLAAGFDAGRVLLGILGATMTAYYGYMLVYLLTQNGFRVSGIVILALGLWLIAFVFCCLPPVGRGMLSYRRRFAAYVGGYR